LRSFWAAAASETVSLCAVYTMDAGLVYTLVFILFMVVVLAGLIGGIIYLTADGGNKPPEKPATTTYTTSTSTTTTESPITPTSSSSTLTTTSTTTTLGFRVLTVTYSPEKLYRLDDAVLTVESGGSPITGALVYVDGEYSGSTADGSYDILSLTGGMHEVVVVKQGYMNVSVTVTVSEDTYATSKDVHRELSLIERNQAFLEGKADVRFYTTPFCVNCAQVRRKLDKLVDDNRECIVYEKLSYYKYRNELGGGDLPFIIVQGDNGEFTVNGLVSMSRVEDMIERASGCDMR
jgi:hypothetical protein